MLILGGIIGVFGAYPAVDAVFNKNFTNTTGFITWTGDGSGTVVNGMTNMPNIFNRKGPIDPDTPEDVRNILNSDGVPMTLVFSDEFNVDGRTL